MSIKKSEYSRRMIKHRENRFVPRANRVSIFSTTILECKWRLSCVFFVVSWPVDLCSRFTFFLNQDDLAVSIQSISVACRFFIFIERKVSTLQFYLLILFVHLPWKNLFGQSSMGSVMSTSVEKKQGCCLTINHTSNFFFFSHWPGWYVMFKSPSFGYNAHNWMGYNCPRCTFIYWSPGVMYNFRLAVLGKMLMLVFVMLVVHSYSKCRIHLCMCVFFCFEKQAWINNTNLYSEVKREEVLLEHPFFVCCFFSHKWSVWIQEGNAQGARYALSLNMKKPQLLSVFVPLFFQSTIKSQRVRSFVLVIIFIFEQSSFHFNSLFRVHLFFLFSRGHSFQIKRDGLKRLESTPLQQWKGATCLSPFIFSVFWSLVSYILFFPPLAPIQTLIFSAFLSAEFPFFHDDESISISTTTAHPLVRPPYRCDTFDKFHKFYRRGFQVPYYQADCFAGWCVFFFSLVHAVANLLVYLFYFICSSVSFKSAKMNLL